MSIDKKQQQQQRTNEEEEKELDTRWENLREISCVEPEPTQKSEILRARKRESERKKNKK